MSRSRVWVHLFMPALTAGFIAAAWTTRPKPVAFPAEFVAARKQLPTGFIDDAKCASCHPEIAARYAKGGMGQAFASWKVAERVEKPTDGPGPVLTLGDLHYQVIAERGRLFEREYRIDEEGKEVDLNRHEALYVLGSGRKGRAHFLDWNGYLFALPISWYSTKNAWDFAPGYRTENVRFSRPMPHGCMECHNAPFGALPGTRNGYVEPLPAGLGCQRCHGPGEDHVAFQESGRHGNDPMPAIGKLEPPRQLDVCLQCHLLSDFPLARGNAGPFRPGDKLADRRVDYFAVDKADAFVAVGHGPRMMASKCFEKSGGKMTCTLCHDPHGSAHTTPRAFYNQRCDGCHDAISCKRPLEAGDSARQGDCVSCHMPVRVADNIPHASATDHLIQAPNRPPGLALPPIKQQGAKLVAWTPSTPIEDAIVLAQMTSTKGTIEARRRAIETLDALLKRSPEPNAEGWLEVARGFTDLDDLPQAKEAARRATLADPSMTAARERYAGILGRMGDQALRADVLEKGLRSQPWCNTGDLALVDALARIHAELRAFELYDRYLQYHPPNLDALLLLGEMKLRAKAPSYEAAAFFEKAKAADGASPLPYLALAQLATADGANAAAAAHAHAAVVRAPKDASLRALEAAALARAGDRTRARQAAEKSLELDPSNGQARRILNELEPVQHRSR